MFFFFWVLGLSGVYLFFAWFLLGGLVLVLLVCFVILWLLLFGSFVVVVLIFIVLAVYVGFLDFVIVVCSYLHKCVVMVL